MPTRNLKTRKNWGCSQSAQRRPNAARNRRTNGKRSAAVCASMLTRLLDPVPQTYLGCPNRLDLQMRPPSPAVCAWEMINSRVSAGPSMILSIRVAMSTETWIPSSGTLTPNSSAVRTEMARRNSCSHENARCLKKRKHPGFHSHPEKILVANVSSPQIFDAVVRC